MINRILDVNCEENTVNTYEQEFELTEEEILKQQINKIKNKLSESDTILNTARTIEELYDGTLPQYKIDKILERKQLRQQLNNLTI